MTAPLTIRPDDLSHPDVIALLAQHLQDVSGISRPESTHAFALQQLRRPDVTVWTAWRDSTLAGCGALRELSSELGEIKSMRTATAHLRQGVGAAILEHLISVARQRHYRRLALETGAQDEFIPARTLYQRFGFTACGPFGDYIDDPHSTFMTLELAP